MKLLRFSCLLVLLLCVIRGYGQGRVIDDSLYSDALGEIRLVDVYLPEGYDEDSTRYSVIYFLHGGHSNQNGYPFLIGILDSLIANEIIQPVIVVKPDGNAGPFESSFYTNSELNGAVEDYITQDLVDYIDSTYRTLAVRDKRALMGHSMGGVGTMMLGLRHPELYRGWASHCGRTSLDPDNFWISQILAENGGSGPYDPDAGSFTQGAFAMASAYSPNLENPPYFVDFILDSAGNRVDSVYAQWLLHYPACNPPLNPGVATQAIYFDCGLQDELGNYPANVAFAETLDARGLAYEFQSFIGGHIDRLPERFPISLAFLDSVLQVSTCVENEERSASEVLSLYPNYPNPFNASTTIQYVLPKAADVRIIICDVLGRHVETLANGWQNAGVHSIVWQPNGNASGTYFYHIQVGDHSVAKSCILLK